MRFSLIRSLGVTRPAVALVVVLLAGAGAVSANDDDYSPGFVIRPAAPEITKRTLAALELEAGESAKVWVAFTDKRVFDSETCRRRLAVVADRLTEHAAIRRARTMTGHLVDFMDIPVPTDYVSRVTESGGKVLRESRWLNAVSVRASEEALREIANLPFVHTIRPVRTWRSRHVEPSAPHRSRAAGRSGRDIFDYGPSYDQLMEIGVVSAHNAGYSGDGVIVAMLDTGFKHDHPAFQHIIDDGRLLAQWDFVNDDGETMDETGDIPGTNDHGSATWSVLASFFEGELIGPAYGASFILAKTEDVTIEDPIEEDNWVAAAEWVDQLGADVISSSLAYSDWYTVDDMDGDTAVITIAADIAVSRGIVVCTAAGNMGDQDWRIITPPADGDSVSAVGAVDQTNEVAGFSSRGPTADGRTKPEVVARGIGTVCACNFTHDPLDDEFATNNGTSLSCPLVAGSAALLLEADPALAPMMVRNLLMITADNAGNPDNDRGWGRIDVFDAIGLTVDVSEVARTPFDLQLLASPNPFTHETAFDVRLPPHVSETATAALIVFDVTGRRVRGIDVNLAAGRPSWDGHDSRGRRVTRGVYFAHLSVADWRVTTKIVLQ